MSLRPELRRAAIVLRALVERSGIDPARIDDVVFAQGYGNGEAPAIGRWAALAAGLPVEVPGYQLDRRCGSGLQAVIDAAMMVQTGAADVVVAGGVESMSQVEHYTLGVRGGVKMGGVTLHDRLTRGRLMSQPIARFGVISGMIATAENVATDCGITREASDAYAARSHARAAAAWEARRFDDEIVPMAVPQKRGEPVMFARDEGIRVDATPESLALLRPIEGGVVTAGNASGVNDGACALLLASEAAAAQHGLTPRARVVGMATVGVPPRVMGIGPAPATQKVLALTGLKIEQMDVIELNEAFAAQGLAVLHLLGLQDDDPRVNPNGGAIALGHPLGASGARLATTAVNQLVRNGGRYALCTMCIGVGQGIALVLERV